MPSSLSVFCGIILCEQIHAVLVHTDSFPLCMFRKGFVQRSRQTQFELPGIPVCVHRFGNRIPVFQLRFDPGPFCVLRIRQCFRHCIPDGNTSGKIRITAK